MSISHPLSQPILSQSETQQLVARGDSLSPDGRYALYDRDDNVVTPSELDLTPEHYRAELRRALLNPVIPGDGGDSYIVSDGRVLHADFAPAPVDGETDVYC